MNFLNKINCCVLLALLFLACDKDSNAPKDNTIEKITVKDLYDIGLLNESGIYVSRSNYELDSFVEAKNLPITPKYYKGNSFVIFFSVFKDLYYLMNESEYNVELDHIQKTITIKVELKVEDPSFRFPKPIHKFLWGSIPIDNKYSEYDIQIEKKYFYE